MNEGTSIINIARAGMLVTVGRLCSILVRFVGGVIVIRLLSRTEYGLISMGSISVSILVLFSTLGFSTGVPRLMAEYREQGNDEFVGKVAGTALLFSVCTSVLFTTLIYLIGRSFLSAFFQKPEFETVIEVMALIVPASVLMQTFTAIFRGIENIWGKVLFQDVSMNLIKLLLLFAIMFLSLGFQGVLWVYVGSAWAALGLYFSYAYHNLKGRIGLNVSSDVVKKLMILSLPLLGMGIITDLMPWISTLSLGYLKTANDVGMFSAPLRLANIIPVPLTATVFLYLPVATRLIQTGDPDELKKLYVSITKWTFFITLPFVMYIFFDAEFLVESLFGEQYRDAADILRVLAIGSCFHTFLGPNGTTLIAYGDTFTVFFGTLLSGLTAVILCFMLIPPYGALGAAIGTAMARMLSNAIISICLYARHRIHPFWPEYTKPLLFIALTGLLIYLLIDLHHYANNLIVHVLLLPLLALLVFGIPIVTCSLSDSDLKLLQGMEYRLWNNTQLSERFGTWVRKKRIRTRMQPRVD